MSTIITQQVSFDSDLIKSLTYVNKDKMLLVLFNTGKAYKYKDVDSDTFEELVSSSSIGRELHKRVFKVFESEKL
jgi:hypothetical protein